MGAQPDDFRYFLTLDNARTEIVFAPDGWDKDTVVTYKRSEDYFGLIRSLALPLQFVLDGATILRQAFYKYGIEAEVRIEVEVLNKENWQYKPFFRGDIDFSKFEDSDDHVSVTLMESGATRNIKAYEGVKYEYELAGPDVVNMVLPGVYFKESAQYIFLPDSDGEDRGTLGLSLVVDDVKSSYIEVKSTEKSGANDDQLINNPNYFVQGKRSEGVNIRIQGNLKGVAFKTIGSGSTIVIQVRDQFSTVIQTVYSSPVIGPLNPVQFDFDFDFNHTLGKDQKLFFYTRTNVYPAELKSAISDGNLTVSYSATSDSSNCKGVSAYSLYKRIMNRISPGTSIESFMLKNDWKNLIFTCGDGIREIATAKIKITLKDFYKTFDGLQDAAFGLEKGTARLEDGNYFTRNIQVIDLGEVKGCKLIPYDPMIFNSVKIGYEDGNTDNTDGKEEYNSGQVWAMPITRIQKQQDWISPTRADQFGIEKLRLDYNIRNSDAKKTTDDTSSDNDVFMIECNLDGLNYRPILGSSYSRVEWLTSGKTAYNLNLTPKKNLIRHAGYLRSMLDKLDSRYINFGSGDKNTALLTIKDGVRVKESENLPVSQLSGKYFIPYIATFTAKMPVNAMWLIDNSPFGYIAFTWNNVKLKGYILEVSIDIAKNTEQEFKLLLTNDNDLQNLI